MLKEVILLVGISGAGKSTWSSQFVRDNKSYVRLNRDDIRKMLTCSLSTYYQRKDLFYIENSITDIVRFSLASFLGKGKSVILDNTHLKQYYIKEIVQFCKTNEVDLKIKIFKCDKYVAKQRVHDRDSVSTAYIDKQVKQFEEILKFIETNHKDKII